MDGWIKLHRKMLENPIACKDADYMAVWIYLLLNATHKEHQVVFAGEKIPLQPGQLITGRKSISEKLNISESKVQRILKSFEIEQQIEQQKSNKNRIVSILSWADYQTDEQQNEQPVNNKRTTTEQQVNTNKNVRMKEHKNDKKKDINTFSVYTSNTELIGALESFIEFRKKIKKPMTDNAIKLLLNSLDKLATEDHDKIAILEQSILNGWQGIFALKNNEVATKTRYTPRQTKPIIPVVQNTSPTSTLSQEEMDKALEMARRLDANRKKREEQLT